MTDADINEATGSLRPNALREELLEREILVEHGTTPDGGQVSGTQPLWRQMLGTFMHNKLAVISAVFIVALVVLCIAAPFLYGGQYWSYAPTYTQSSCFLHSQTVSANLGTTAPSMAHWLGCTKGYDDIALLFYAGRYSLAIGFLAALVNMTLGVGWGIFAGFRGGKVDAVMMRFIDVMLSVPGLYLLLFVIVLFGRSLWALVWVLGFTGWFGVSRLMRSEAQVLREREYVQASTAMGATRSRIMWKHILPNGASTMITAGTFAIGDAVLALATIGFLGLGLLPPQFDWGTMIQQGTQNGWSDGDWWVLWPVAAIFILFVLSTNYIGDALRDAFDVRLTQR